MFDDILASAKETLLDRLTSPLIGSFVVAWPLWNYKFVMILLSENTVTTTLRLIDSVAFPEWYSVWLRGIAAPLFSALAYVFLYPYPAKYIFKFVRLRQSELNQIRNEIEGGQLLTLEESRKIRSDTRAEIARYKEAADDLSNELQQLRAELEKRTTSLPSSDNGSENTRPQRGSASELSNSSVLGADEYLVLKEVQTTREEIGEYEDMDSDRIVRGVKTTVLRAQAAIDRLKDRGLLVAGSRGLKVTPKGRAALLEQDDQTAP